MAASSSSSDWRNVRVKEEPMSDVEDRGQRSSSSHHGRGVRDRGDRGYRDRDRGRGGGGRGDDDGGRRSIKRERKSPSPPPSHSNSKHRSSRPASRSRSRSRSRSPPTNRDGERGGRRGGGDGGSSRSKSKGSSRWERSSERSGPGRSESHDRDNRDRERRRPSSRERSRPNESEIKRERGSSDRDLLGFKRPPPQDRRGGGGRGGDSGGDCFKCGEPGHFARDCPTGGGGGRGGGGRGGGPGGDCYKCGEPGHFARECPTGGGGGRGGGGPNRPRDGKREKDWDNFFNPKSEMSQQAFNKRDREEQDRKVAIQEGEFGGGGAEGEDEKPKEQPNFGLSGKLTEETNTFRGVVIKYSEPPEARKPNKIKWRFYPFKGEEALDVMYVHRQSAYLIGRDRKIADMPVDHPSCSKQHAVLQYRLVPYERADGSKGRRIKPYVIDLESANGTFVNGKQIDSKRYVELFEKDVLKFGFSSREYVLLHDESKDIQDDSPELTPD